MSDISASERGETVGRRTRIIIRVSAVLVLVVATLGVALVREREQERERERAEALKPSTTETAAAEDDPLEHAARESRLLAAEDARLRQASLGEAVGIARVGDTVVLGARRRPYSVLDLIRVGGAERTSKTVVTVVRPVLVRRDATLAFSDADRSATLRLASGPKGRASLVAWGGSIELAGSAEKPLKVVGWDVEKDAPDTSTQNGRPYIRVKDGTLVVRHVELSHLGFWSGRTGGLSLTGSNETRAVAAVNHVRADDLHIGFYASGAQRVRSKRLTVVRPQRHGVELTNRSTKARFEELVVRDAGEDGVSVSNGTSDVTLMEPRIHDSGGWAVDMNGSPLAEGLNSAGYGVDNYAGLSLSDGSLLDNRAGGVRLRAVDDVRLSATKVRSEPHAVVVHGAAKGVVVSEADLASSDASALVLDERVTDAVVRDSTLEGHEVGIEVEDSSAEIIGNEITVGTGHGVQVSGRKAEAEVADNEIHGRGSGAVSADGGATLDESGESDGDWTYRPEAVMWAERHSAAMPLLFVLVIPAAGLVFVLRRRRQQRELRRLFEDSMVSRGRAAIATYQRPTSDPATEPEPEEAAEPVAEPVLDPVPEPVGPSLPGLAGREFATAQEFAVAAVTEAGYAPGMVARVLHVPTSRVRDWVAAREE